MSSHKEGLYVNKKVTGIDTALAGLRPPAFLPPHGPDAARNPTPPCERIRPDMGPAPAESICVADDSHPIAAGLCSEVLFDEASELSLDRKPAIEVVHVVVDDQVVQLLRLARRRR